MTYFYAAADEDASSAAVDDAAAADASSAAADDADASAAADAADASQWRPTTANGSCKAAGCGHPTNCLRVCIPLAKISESGCKQAAPAHS